MKITLSWLKEHLETDAAVDDIAHALTSIGLEVEEVIDNTNKLAGFETARIVSLEKHPDANKLNVCQVETKNGMVQVVCGASNVYEGLVGILASPGATVPRGNFKIKESTIRGVASSGMMCSLEELDLAESSDGIIELPRDTAVGVPVSVMLHELLDPVFDISITPNRAECAGVRGVARELYAKGLGNLKNIVKKDFQTHGPSSLIWDIKDGSSFIAGRVIKGVKNVESPTWLKNRLARIGIKSKGAIVDITNYVLFDLCRPLHAYDLAKISGDVLSVRRDIEGDFKALNGEAYAIKQGDVVISDAQGAVALAGIMGGDGSAWCEETTDIFLECALFTKEYVAETKRRLGLHTDSAYRFERGVDLAGVLEGLDIATSYILEICGGEASEVTVAGSDAVHMPRFSIALEGIEARMGMTVSSDRALSILEKLGYRDVSLKGHMLEATVPSYRHDVEVKEVLIDDIVRMIGYDTLESVPLPQVSAFLSKRHSSLNPVQRRLFDVKRIMASRGFLETMSYTFVSQSLFDLFGGKLEEAIRVANPISADLEVMRSSVVSSLLIAALDAYNRGKHYLRLFEVGPIFGRHLAQSQTNMVSCLMLGSADKHWRQSGRAHDFYDIKAEAFALLDMMDCNTAGIELIQENMPSYYHPTRSVSLYYQKKHIGYCGECHPEVIRHMGIKGKVSAVAFEIFVDVLPFKKKKNVSFTRTNLQSVKRDFAFVVDKKVVAKELEQAIFVANRQVIKDVSVFDVYEGEALGDKKSVALSVLLSPLDKTFTEQDIQEISNKIIASVQKKTNAQLRA